MSQCQSQEDFNLQNFQGRTYSRQSQFVTEELAALNPLPSVPFEMKSFANAKVQKNYHVMLGEDKHFYSVPVSYVGQTVQIIYNTSTVEVYHQMVRIAIHARTVTAFGYTTIKDHMPPNDRHYHKANGYKKQDFIDQAAQIGENTKNYIEATINARVHEQHAFVGCLGILRLGKEDNYGPKRLEKACSIGLRLQQYSYKVIEGILKRGADRGPDDDDNSGDDHDFLRGPGAF